jgi:hypothetical protein
VQPANLLFLRAKGDSYHENPVDDCKAFANLALYRAPSGYTLPNQWEITYPDHRSRNTVTSEVSKNGTVDVYVCHIGASTIWQGGPILSTEYNHQGSNTFVSADYHSCGGDSGGPVLTDHRAYGMHVAGFCSHPGIYMPVNSFWDKGVHVATTP